MSRRWCLLAAVAVACLLGGSGASGEGLRGGDSPALQAAGAPPGLEILDLMAIDFRLANFIGGFGDGRYVYLVSQFYAPAARIDPEDFTPAGVTALDFTQIDPTLLGFSGGFTDGRYGYFVPFGYPGGQPPFITTVLSGRVVRVDLRNFTLGGVTVLDTATVDPRLVGYGGGFTDGRYGYFIPLDDGSGRLSGLAARVDLWNFAPGGVTPLDLTTADPALRGFWSGFSAGPYVYFIPSSINAPGKIVRVSRDNFTTSGISVLNQAAIDPDLAGWCSGFPQGRYAYLFCSLWGQNTVSSKVARLDLEDFSPSGVTVTDLTESYPQLGGLRGLFGDGRFAYFQSLSNPSVPGPIDALGRVDLANLSPSGTNIFDLAAVDPGLKDLRGGFASMGYGYLVPGADGKLARFPLFVPRYRLLLPVAGRD